MLFELFRQFNKKPLFKRVKIKINIAKKWLSNYQKNNNKDYHLIDENLRFEDEYIRGERNGKGKNMIGKEG